MVWVNQRRCARQRASRIARDYFLPFSFLNRLTVALRCTCYLIPLFPNRNPLRVSRFYAWQVVASQEEPQRRILGVHNFENCLRRSFRIASFLRHQLSEELLLKITVNVEVSSEFQ